jgi:quercetin dioxygenase-like cupin family protein
VTFTVIEKNLQRAKCAQSPRKVPASSVVADGVARYDKEDEMKTKMLGLMILGALALVATATAAAPPPIFAQPVATGVMKATTIHAQTGTAVLDSITIQPGGNFGWHVHGAPVAVIVTSGTLTVFDPKVQGCAPFQVSKGQSFVEPANHIHLARNDGTKKVTLYAFYLGFKDPSRANIPKPQPGICKP